MTSIKRIFDPAISLKRRSEPIPDTEDSRLTAFLMPIVEELLSESEQPLPRCPKCDGTRIYVVRRRKPVSNDPLPVFGCTACNKQFRRTLNTPLHKLARRDRMADFVRLLSQQRSFLNASQILRVDYRVVQLWTARFRAWLLELDPSGRMEALVRLGMRPDLEALICPACGRDGGLVHSGFLRSRKGTRRRQYRCTDCQTFTVLDEPSRLVNVDDRVRGKRAELASTDGSKLPLSFRTKRQSIRELEPEIVQRSRAGETFISIARSLCIDVGTVSRVVRHYNAIEKDVVAQPHRRTGREPLLTPEQCEDIRQRRRDGEKLKALANEFNVSIGLIHATAKPEPTTE